MSDSVKYGKRVRKRAEKRKAVVAQQVPVVKIDRAATAYTQGEDFDRIMEEVPR